MRAHPPGGKERIEVIRSRIGLDGWPDRDLRVTAVEAESGAFVAFDKDSGIDLVHAVAASCAVPLVWPAVTIDGKHYLDGGMRSTANVDLATGADAIVVLAPIPQVFSRDMSIKAQLARTGARRSAVITPDKQALTDIGRNVLDPAKRADAARTGLRQAEDLVAEVSPGLAGLDSTFPPVSDSPLAGQPPEQGPGSPLDLPVGGTSGSGGAHRPGTGSHPRARGPAASCAQSGDNPSEHVALPPSRVGC